MNTLWFVKFENRNSFSPVVFCLTADSRDLAEHNGWNLINPDYRHEFDIKSVEIICTTPDTVECFEPV
jgi:hypothetical protein